jgi:hypothetical protein
MFALEALDRKAWQSYYIWLILALSCKWYIGFAAMALGLILYVLGERKMGLVTAGLGIGWVIISFLIIRPFYAPIGNEAAEARATLSTYFLSRFNIEHLQATIILRLVNAVIVLMPALIVLGWRAPLWLIPAGIIALPALMSSGFGPSFSYRTHHYAAAVPFLMAAIVYGAARLRQRQDNAFDELSRKRYEWRKRVMLTLVVTLVFTIAFVDTPLSPRFYFKSMGSGEGLDVSRYGVTARDRMKERWIIENVPPDVAIASDELLATRLVNREILYLTTRPITRSLDKLLAEVEYVVIDALYDFALANPSALETTISGGILHERDAVKLLLNSPEFTLLKARDGLLLFGRTNPGLTQSVELAGIGDRKQVTRVNQKLGLVEAEITQTVGRRIKIRYDWLRLEPPANDGPMIAITGLEGVEQARMIHLPTWAILPVEKWPADQIIRETIEYEIPDEIQPGTYRLKVSWYDARSIHAPETDEQSRVGKIVDLGVVTVG